MRRARPSAAAAFRRAIRHRPGAGAAVSRQAASAGLALGVEQLRGRAPGAVRGIGALVVVLVQLEPGQRVAPRPGVVAGQLRPLVVVAGLAAHVDHAVDAAAAAQRLAARIAQRAAVQAGGGLGVVEPVGARVADAIQVAHRNVDPVVVVLAAGLDQQHPLGRVRAEPVGQQAAGRAGANDDVVEGGVAHGLSPVRSFMFVHRVARRSRWCQGSRGTGFAGPLVAPP
jgi:hypothetical protein